MDKKSYVLRMLDALKTAWPMADSLKILIETNPLNDTIIDLLVNTFRETIKKLDNKEQTEKLQKAANFLETIKGQESLSLQQDQKDIVALDDMLANI